MRLAAVITRAMCDRTVALRAEVINHSLYRLPRLIQKLQVRWIGDIGRGARGINAERASGLHLRTACGNEPSLVDQKVPCWSNPKIQGRITCRRSPGSGEQSLRL